MFFKKLKIKLKELKSIKLYKYDNSKYSSFNLYKRFFEYMSAYFNRFIISIIAMLVVALSEPLFAWIMKPLIDKGFIAKNHQAVLWTSIAIVIIFFIRGVAAYINETNTTWISASLVEKMRNLMFYKLLKLPVQYYNDHNSGRILSRIIFDVNQINDAGFNLVTVTIRDGFTVIGLIGFLFYIDWELTGFCLITLPLVLVLVRILAYKLRRLSSKNQQQYGEMTQIITEAVHGQKIVKLFEGYNYELNRFEASSYNIKRNNFKQTAVSSLNSGLSQFLLACSLAMILYFAASKATDNHLTTGDFVAFISAIVSILPPIKRITNVTQTVQRGIAAMRSVFEFLDEEVEVNQGKQELLSMYKGITFKNVCFKYPNLQYNVLNNINLLIPQGTTLALVGSSGSGKTTLANLIPRFYIVNQGQIMIDNINVNDFDLNSLRRYISLVSQDVVLFNDSIFKNIAYGIDQEKVTLNDVINAAKLANAFEFIDNLPNGFDTMVGENGMRLSGGQKQRLAIARAFLKNAPILILDEATSALDNQSEKLVQEALDRLMAQKKTTIVIAHRLSTVLNADKIVVLTNGAICEEGTHQELLVKNQVYANLYNLQDGSFK